MKNKMLVIGLGVIGIPTAYLFAEKGFNVTGYDTDKSKIENLKNKTYKFTDDVNEVSKNLEGSITFVDFIDKNEKYDYILVCVGVNVGDDSLPDFCDFDNVIKSISELDIRGAVICIETTLPVGKSRNTISQIEGMSGYSIGEDFNFIFAPERITINRLIYNMENLPRVVGGCTDKCRELGRKLYSTININIKTATLEEAEMSKLVENTYRDVNIALANEVYTLCDRYSTDFLMVRELVNSLPNVSGDDKINPVRNLHFAGMGVGGYCLPKDPWILLTGDDNYFNYDSIIRTARLLNAKMPDYFFNKMRDKLFKYKINKLKHVLILGYSGIPNTDDCRNNYVDDLKNTLLKSYECKVDIYDPHVSGMDRFVNNLSNYNVVFYATPHNIFDKEFPDYIDKLKSDFVLVQVHGRFV